MGIPVSCLGRAHTGRHYTNNKLLNILSLEYSNLKFVCHISPFFRKIKENKGVIFFLNSISVWYMLNLIILCGDSPLAVRCKTEPCSWWCVLRRSFQVLLSIETSQYVVERRWYTTREGSPQDRVEPLHTLGCSRWHHCCHIRFVLIWLCVSYPIVLNNVNNNNHNLSW